VAGAGQISDLVAAVNGAAPPLGPGLGQDLGTKLKEASASLAKNKPKLIADQA
jgi:hypothetical protein